MGKFINKFSFFLCWDVAANVNGLIVLNCIYSGGKTAKCLMKTGSWVQQATGKCVKWQPVHSECELPTKINNKLSHGKWHCKTKTVSSDRYVYFIILIVAEMMHFFKL